MSSRREQQQLLGFGIQRYQLCLNNRDIEDATDDSNPESTASNFEVSIQPTLDISNLLFLKSTDAEVSLDEITIDNTCLTFRASEQIKCYLQFDTRDTLNINWLNSDVVLNEYHRKKPMLLQFNDYIATSNTDAVDYLNSLLERNVNHLIVHGYLLNFFDTDIFRSDFFNDLSTDHSIKLTNDELGVIFRWMNITLFIRKTIYDTLATLITGETPELFPFSYIHSRVAPRSINHDIINVSSSLSKTHESARDGRIIDLELFDGVDLTKISDETVTNKVATIKTRFNSWLDRVLRKLSEEDKQIRYLKLLHGTATAIQQGLKAHNILKLEQDRNGKTGVSRALFNTDFLHIQVDNTRQKAMFHINGDQ